MTNPEIPKIIEKHKRCSYNTSFNYHAWVCDSGKYLCMTIPKVSCTRIKTSLFQLEGGRAPVQIGQIHRLGSRLTHLPMQTALEAINSRDWFRFAFVRNPYDRIFSAYKSKIGNPADKQYSKIRQVILNRFYPKSVSRRTDSIPSFSDFVRYVSESPDTIRDGHWKSQVGILNLHLISYSYIGRFENFEDDFSSILKRLAAPNELIRSAKEVLNPTYEIPLPFVYNTELADLVYKIYEKDFIAFDYDKDSWIIN